MRKPPSKFKIWTVGHSTRPIGELIEILEKFAIEELADVRTIPRSKYNPQYNSDELEAFLKEKGIGYRHRKGLGGLRHPKKDSMNTGWKNSSFRGYADYMRTEEFKNNLEQLMESAAQHRTVLMCAEAVPWRCHRSLLTDALVIRGIEVIHIMDLHHSHPQQLTAFAAVNGGELTYPPEQMTFIPPTENKKRLIKAKK